MQVGATLPCLAGGEAVIAELLDRLGSDKVACVLSCAFDFCVHVFLVILDLNMLKCSIFISVVHSDSLGLRIPSPPPDFCGMLFSLSMLLTLATF